MLKLSEKTTLNGVEFFLSSSGNFATVWAETRDGPRAVIEISKYGIYRYFSVGGKYFNVDEVGHIVVSGVTPCEKSEEGVDVDVCLGFARYPKYDEEVYVVFVDQYGEITGHLCFFWLDNGKFSLGLAATNTSCPFKVALYEHGLWCET